MKKVRLFAVAAALGMFAASVNAAGPVLTKDAYKATWGTMDEIVRAEIGGKVVLPTPSVSVTKQTRSTDPEKATSTGGLFGSTLNNNCFVGLTDTVGKDTNSDGLVDWDMLFVNQGTGYTYGTSTPNAWYYDDLKFWPTVKTSLYYIGMTGNGLGARFIAPNAAAEKGWIISSTHTKYATEADVLTALETQGVVKAVKDSRGDIVKYVVGEKVYKDTNDKAVAKVWVEYVAGSGRYDLQELPEYVVSKFDGATLSPAITSVNTVVKAVEYYAASNISPVVYSAVLPSTATGDGANLANKVLIVEEDRYGELKVVDASTVAVGTVAPDTTGKVVVALKDGTSYSKYMTITPAVPTSGTKYSMSWDSVANSFSKKDTSVTDLDALAVTLLGAGKVKADLQAAAEPVGIKTAKGLYKYNNPANTTDKIVINFDLGVYGWTLTVNGINTSKSTMTFVDAENKELTTSAVKLGNKWYPTVNNIDELNVFVKRMAGLYAPAGDKDGGAYKAIYDQMKAKKAYSTITWLDGTKNAEYIPENAKAHYKTSQCTYVSGETAVDAASVVVTNNASEIDTNQYGVHTVKLTAKVGETTVGTKDVKVVIAPKYVREYKNGRVTSLKAYHLNGNLYSHTTFDYAAKKSTAVFYNQDGVTAIETQTNDIK